MRHRITLFLLLLAAPSTASAAVRVRGVVRDPGGGPIAAAIVTLRGGGVEAKTASDTGGRFEVDWQGPDEVSVTVDAKGYAVRRQPLRISEAAESGVTFVMAPVAFGEEVTVTGGASRPDTGESAASVTVLT